MKLVLIRHGESAWNKENRFTGWMDVELSEKGVSEALQAAELLKQHKFEFDRSYTSLLTRSIRTLNLILEVNKQLWIPVTRAWELNERHYGALQGLNKDEMAAKYSPEQVFEWRRSYSVLPPLLKASDERHPKHDRRYKGLKASALPPGESLATCSKRVIPYWKKEILPRIKKGERIIIAAHGNSLRALVKHLDGISDEKISELNIPTGCPLIYELTKSGARKTSYYLK